MPIYTDFVYYKVEGHLLSDLCAELGDDADVFSELNEPATSVWLGHACDDFGNIIWDKVTTPIPTSQLLACTGSFTTIERNSSEDNLTGNYLFGNGTCGSGGVIGSFELPRSRCPHEAYVLYDNEGPYCRCRFGYVSQRHGTHKVQFDDICVKSHIGLKKVNFSMKSMHPRIKLFAHNLRNDRLTNCAE